jgi:hypothetical protein
MIKNCCYISRGLFRLVGVRSVAWVVRDAVNNCVIINMHGKTTIKKNKSGYLISAIVYSSCNV